MKKAQIQDSGLRFQHARMYAHTHWSVFCLQVRTFNESVDPVDFQDLCDGVYLNDVMLQM